MNRSGGIKVIASAKLGGKITLEALFCFPALRFGAFSPHRETRYCGAPKPGKEEQKSYDYRSAILIIHRVNPSICVHPLMRKIWREVTQKMAAQFETWAFPKVKAGQQALELRNHPSRMHTHCGCMHDSAQRRTVLMSGRRDRYLSYSVKSFQTLHLNYSDQMAQLVFDVARHGDGMSDLLAQ